MNINMSNGSVTVNGQTYTGDNIKIDGESIVVDGVYQAGVLTGKITVEVHGDVDKLVMGSGNVTAKNINNCRTSSGDVNCHLIGNLQTGSGDVEAGDVGNIQTSSGDVDCGDVSGDIKTTSGDINYTKSEQ